MSFAEGAVPSDNVGVAASGRDLGRTQGRAGRQRSVAWRRRDRAAGYLYILPAVVFLAMFIVYPLVKDIQYSFENWDGVGPATYAGFSNYAQLWRDPVESSSLAHIGELFIFFALIPVAVGLLVASLIGRVQPRGSVVFRAIFFLPQVIVTVVIAIVWTWLLAPSGAGSFNGLLHAVGLGPAVGPSWLGDFNTSLIALGLIAVWIDFGLCFLLFLSGVQKISPELYNSARLDGAGLIREFFYITVPLLRREIAAAIVITTVMALQGFTLVYTATGGGPGTSTTIPGILILRDAFDLGQVGTAAALAITLAVLVFAVTFGIRALLERKAE
ncbi:MAG TPA: sugar ABC transporter permease [Acidimicrobiales bacterium]|nr:sugar ABC transporter permease [Acidimicrobiales bacterium]